MKKRFPVIFSLISLLIASVCCAVSVYAWFVANDRAGSMSFQIARINSEVYFYTAKDSNFNGVPDLISADYAPAESEEEKHDLYYTENRYFDFVKKTEAKAETEGQTFDEVSMPDFLADVVPSKIFTAKLSLVNKGDTTNDVTIRFNGKTFSEAEETAAKIYSTFAVRAVKMVNEGEATENASYEAGEWLYFCDYASKNGSEWVFSTLAAETKAKLRGLDAQNAEGNTKILNVCDYWLQFRMVPYGTLLEKESFTALGIAEADYQAMQGTENAVSFALSVLFEVDV